MSEQNVITLQNDYTTMDNIKAAPSVYSPNNGNFNSEENLKWLANKLATKPFVIGKTTEEMRDNMKPILDGNIIKISDGLFSIQGYTFKMAEQGNLSYDFPIDENNESAIVNITNADKFVTTITSPPSDEVLSQYYGMSIENDLVNICFDTYNPSSVPTPITDDGWETLQASWESTIKKHNPIGYIRIIYPKSIRNILTTDEDYITYKDTKVRNVESSEVYTEIEDGTTHKINLSGILSFLNDNTYGLSLGDCFGILLQSQSDTSLIQLNAYYPVYAKWHREINNEKKYPVIYFKDIFGTTFYHSESFVANYEYIKDVSTDVIKEQTTNYYPYTNSNFINMYENLPESSILTDDYELFSKPTKIYAYYQLYDGNYGSGNRKTELTSYEGAPVENVGPEKIRSEQDESSATVFSKMTLSDLVQYIPEDDDKYTTIENTLYYYVLNSVIDEYKLTVTVNGQTKNVPVVFMASNGKLCPDGIFVDNADTTVTNIYPAEGYVHFIKRMYWRNIGESNPTEEMISSVTPGMIMTTWTFNNNFSNFYRDYISKAVSIYLSWCYSALMSHSIFEKINNVSDSYKIKAIGCGNALLLESPSTITDEGLYVSQQYSYTGYERTTNGLVTKSMVATLPYYKNTKSDFLLVKNGVVIDNDNYNNICGDGSLRYLSNKIPSDIDPKTSSTLGAAALLFDDPINLIQKCSLKTSTSEKLNLSTFRLWFVIINANASGYVTSSKVRNFSNVVLDDNFMPVTPEIEVTEENAADSEYKTPFVYPDKLAGRFITYNDSMINSMRFTIRTLSWYASIWETVNLKKDALNYLCGRYIPQTPDPEDPQDEYDGIHFNPKVRADFNKDDLGIYQILISSNNTNTNTGFQDLDKYISYSEESDVVRGSYIHIDKVYGDDDKSLDEIIRELVNAIEAESEPVDLTQIYVRLSQAEEDIRNINIIDNNQNANIQGLDTRLEAVEQKLDPYIVTKYNMGYTSQGTPTDSIIAEVYNNGMCIIRGSGEMYDFINFDSNVTDQEQINTFIKYYRPDNPEYILPPDGTANPPIQQITDVIIMPGITTIGAGVFDRPSKLPGTDTDIDPFDFNSVTIPDTVEFIGANALWNTNTKGIELNRNGLSGLTCGAYSLGTTGIKSLYVQSNDNFSQDALSGILGYARNYVLQNVVFDIEEIDSRGLGQDLGAYNNITLTRNVKKLNGPSFFGARRISKKVESQSDFDNYKEEFSLYTLKYMSNVHDFLDIEVEYEQDTYEGYTYNFCFIFTGYVYSTSDYAGTTFEDKEYTLLKEVICNDCIIRYSNKPITNLDVPEINGLKFFNTAIPDNWLFGVSQSNFHRPVSDTVGWIMYIDNTVKYIGNNAFAGQSSLQVIRYNGTTDDFSDLIDASGMDWMSTHNDTKQSLNSNITYVVCNNSDGDNYDWLRVDATDTYQFEQFTPDYEDQTSSDYLDPAYRPSNWDMYWKIEQS